MRIQSVCLIWVKLKNWGPLTHWHQSHLNLMMFSPYLSLQVPLALHLRGRFNPQKFGVRNHCSRCWIWVGSWTYPLQFLPLAHIYERVFLQYGLISGMKIGYPQGPLPTTLFEDIKVLEPTFFVLSAKSLYKVGGSN